MYGFFYMLYAIAVSATPEPPTSNFMITENDNYMDVEGTINRMITE